MKMMKMISFPESAESDLYFSFVGFLVPLLTCSLCLVALQVLIEKWDRE